MTFQQVVDKVLKEHSRILMADPTLSIADVSERLGLSDSSGIYRRFRRWFDLTPEQFRHQLNS
jgi:AraC-like DNA-binding protein